ALLVGTAIVVIPVLAMVFAWSPAIAGAQALPPGAAEAAGAIAGSGQSPGFADWLVSLVPPNPVAAAANGAMLQLIVFTLLFALAVASSSRDARDVLLSF